MIKKSVEYFRVSMKMYQAASLHSPGASRLFPDVDPELLKKVDSLPDLLALNSRAAMSCESVNIVMFISIKKLMDDYLNDLEEYSLTSVIKGFFDTRYRLKYQLDRAVYILTMMKKHQLERDIRERRGLEPMRPESLDTLRDRIIAVLEEGLMMKHLSPDDNFPRIVEAIARETEGFPYFMFSEQAISFINQKNLNEMMSHQTSVCC